jgi:hypothetical protein
MYIFKDHFNYILIMINTQTKTFITKYYFQIIVKYKSFFILFFYLEIEKIIKI